MIHFSLFQVNVIAKLPEQFNEWLESKKWTERRDALQALVNEMSKTPRLDPKVDYFNITQSLRNVNFHVYFFVIMSLKEELLSVHL